MTGLGYDDFKANKDRYYVLLKRRVTSKVLEQVQALKLPGLHVQEEAMRTYPADSLGEPLLGFANYAEVSLTPKMAKSPQAALAFLQEVAARAKPHAERDMAALSAISNCKPPGSMPLDRIADSVSLTK